MSSRLPRRTAAERDSVRPGANPFAEFAATPPESWKPPTSDPARYVGEISDREVLDRTFYHSTYLRQRDGLPAHERAETHDLRRRSSSRAAWRYGHLWMAYECLRRVAAKLRP